MLAVPTSGTSLEERVTRRAERLAEFLSKKQKQEADVELVTEQPCEGREHFTVVDVEVKLVEHHWPQFISIAEARKLGQTRMLCYECNNRLAYAFPNIGNVSWKTQLDELEYYEMVREVGEQAYDE